jgi:ABC-2 type transport system permease protein
MRQNTPASLSSTRIHGRFASEVQALTASLQAKMVERLQTVGRAGYMLIWMLRPIFELSIAALIYRDARPDLIRYIVITLAAQSLIFNTLFYVGEILDRERITGTLSALFLTPCARISWLSGFSLAGFGETVLMATSALLFGRFVLGVHIAPNIPALLLAFVLFYTALWGIGIIFSGLGLVLKKSNQLANLIYAFTILLGGIYYPVALLPDWLRLPARLLPFGYGMQALADAALDHASIAQLRPTLLPLAGFAVVLPLAGVLIVQWLEWLARERGSLDLY